MDTNTPPPTDAVIHNQSLLSSHDIYLFKEGNHFRLYEKLGSHLETCDGAAGAFFGVWAPSAVEVSVIADFNQWQPGRHALKLREDGSGIWEGFIPGVNKGALYKYHIVSRFHNYRVDKGDPYAFLWETPAGTASIVWDLAYQWQDAVWMKERAGHNSLIAPQAVYEVHLGSWKRVLEENRRYLSYRELATDLVRYVKEMGFTHVELLPVMEHPFYGSWGYQTIGHFAPSSRYGVPQDFMYLVDAFHQNQIGVILDWVPSHFPSDVHGLVYFDGTHLYEHADMRLGFHPDWKSYIYNYGRNEVRNFLISSALFWLDKYHADGLRVDGVASMLYRDYSRQEGEWLPNENGGRENFQAISFLKRFNETVYVDYPDVQTIAEESTAWSKVTRPPYAGGLGFGLKWNMGWMHDTLKYFSQDPLFRKDHHNHLTFGLLYAFMENFILSLSHDEVVYGKCSLVNKMPGDQWRKFANLRLLFGYMYAYPGKKLLFMGGEFGQWNEWSHEASLDWHLLQFPFHKGIRKWVQDLNALYKGQRALYEQDFISDGFEWVDFHDRQNSIISFIRKSKSSGETILAVCNFTPIVRNNYRVGVPLAGTWKELLNSDAEEYGGSGQGNCGGVNAEAVAFSQKFPGTISLILPPLGVLLLKQEPEAQDSEKQSTETNQIIESSREKRGESSENRVQSAEDREQSTEKREKRRDKRVQSAEEREERREGRGESKK